MIYCFWIINFYIFATHGLFRSPLQDGKNRFFKFALSMTLQTPKVRPLWNCPFFKIPISQHPQHIFPNQFDLTTFNPSPKTPHNQISPKHTTLQDDPDPIQPVQVGGDKVGNYIEIKTRALGFASAARSCVARTFRPSHYTYNFWPHKILCADYTPIWHICIFLF